MVKEFDKKISGAFIIEPQDLEQMPAGEQPECVPRTMSSGTSYLSLSFKKNIIATYARKPT